MDNKIKGLKMKIQFRNACRKVFHSAALLMCTAIITSFQSASAFPFQSNSFINQTFVCGGGVGEVALCPLMVENESWELTAATLVQLTKTDQPECEWNPNDIGCDQDEPDFNGIVRIQVIYPETNYYSVKDVQVHEINGNITISSVTDGPISSMFLQQKELLIELNEAYVERNALSEFVEGDDGVLRNIHNVPLEDIWPESPGEFSGDLFPHGCTTATDVLTGNNLVSIADNMGLANCRSRLKNAIEYRMNSPSSKEMGLLRMLDNFAVGNNTASFGISFDKLLSGGISVELRDGSVAHFDVNINDDGTITATLNKIKSKTINGESFKDFEDEAKNGERAFERIFKFPEMVNFLALAKVNCTFDVLGYKHIIEYTTRTEDGKEVLDTVVSYTIRPEYIKNCSSSRGVSGPFAK